MELRPTTGGFLRPFGTAWFIIEFLKGNGPEDSKRINPEIGAPMTDIHDEMLNVPITVDKTNVTT